VAPAGRIVDGSYAGVHGAQGHFLRDLGVRASVAGGISTSSSRVRLADGAGATVARAGVSTMEVKLGDGPLRPFDAGEKGR
jgi:hypothetical protein